MRQRFDGQQPNPTPMIATKEAIEMEEWREKTTAEAIEDLARQVKIGLARLGTNDACTQMGAIEALSVSVKEGLDNVASSIDGLANAILALRQ